MRPRCNRLAQSSSPGILFYSPRLPGATHPGEISMPKVGSVNAIRLKRG